MGEIFDLRNQVKFVMCDESGKLIFILQLFTIRTVFEKQIQLINWGMTVLYLPGGNPHSALQSPCFYAKFEMSIEWMPDMLREKQSQTFITITYIMVNEDRHILWNKE